jgi:hypothetical protein
MGIHKDPLPNIFGKVNCEHNDLNLRNLQKNVLP